MTSSSSDGALVPEPGGTTMRFARDQVFASPSAAAAVITGRQANGRVDWKAEAPASASAAGKIKASTKRPQKDRR